MRLTRYLTEAQQQLKQWNGYVKSNKMLASAVKVLKKIESKGYKAWIVGGSVRDIIIGKQPHDIDLCTNCPEDVLGKLYKLHPIGNSDDFGIWLIKEGGYSYEIAMLRSENYMKPKYVRRIL